MLRTAIRDVTTRAARQPASIRDLPIGQAIALLEIHAAALLREADYWKINPRRRAATVQRSIDELRAGAPQTQLQQFTEDRYALAIYGLALLDPVLGLRPTEKAGRWIAAYIGH